MPYYAANTPYATAGTTAHVWIDWTMEAYNVQQSNAATAWITWTSNGSTGGTAITANPYQSKVAARAAQYAAQLAADVEARRAVSARAKALLDSVLTDVQRSQLATERHFDVIAGRSKRRYRIHYSTHGNVRLLDAEGREVTRYCGQPANVPTEDAMLAQMLQLEHDEDAFLTAANATRVA